ncbi:MAG: DNA repair protein RecO [Candidatus Mcinerneyibacterium aminivorans]|uniref:DNA repair protein RecO n=1 Tax=Candidatus Mcinerneyibacterium aminivorans TaxID=2703815 RepID=A0A5D0MIK6_9BACT|nr:MAG: DNA repair protein RecO [Candidatus Mcinerneyibacterium aminivorans]
MSKIKLEGFILYKTKFQNTSLIFDFFTREKGRLSFIAKGALREKSKFLGELEFLNYLHVFFYYRENKGIYTLADTELIKSSEYIIKEPDVFFKLGELVSFIRKTIPQKEKHPEIYDKFKIMLRGIRNGKSYKAILYFFYFFLKFLGWKISFNNQCQCGNSANLNYLDYSNGSFSCNKCKKGFELNRNFYKDIEMLIFGNAKNLFIDKNKFMDYYLIFKKYLTYHIS